MDIQNLKSRYGIIGNDPKLLLALNKAVQVAATDLSILITGESGVGKSETALELVERGHRLVADDLVEISRNGDYTLIGAAPEITRHFVELRGIGVVDIKSLYGVECVKESQTIDLVIKLEDWKKEADYDRRRDFLTGLRNRQDMFELLHDGLSNKRENIKSMFMMDIDNFKKVNYICPECQKKSACSSSANNI